MTVRENVINLTEVIPITIASGNSLSNAVDLGGLRLFGIFMPSVWTAANLTLQMSPDGGTTWVNLYDIYGNEVTVIAASSKAIVLDPVTYASLRYLRVRSGTSSTPVAQAQDSTLQLVTRCI
jgi:hypothetical protein